MAARTIGWITPGEIKTGVWCPACRLPSAVEVTVSLLTSDGVRPLTRCTVCHDCGRQMTERNP